MLTAVVAACLALRPPPALPAAALGGAGRRAVLNTVGAALVGGLLPGAVVQPAAAVEALTLEDLPPKALSAYNQYWPALQLAADSYVFDVYDLLDNPGRWDSIAALTESSDIGSAASVSSLEREYLTPMRILTLSFPPDAGGDEMQEALDKFQASAFRLSAQARRGQTTGNVAQPSVEEVAAVLKSWDDGRMSINAFFDALNTGTSTTRLVGIPPKVRLPGRGSRAMQTQLQRCLP